MIGARGIFNQHWAMKPEALEDLMATVDQAVRGPSAQQFNAMGFQRRDEEEARVSLLSVDDDGVGTIDISGPLMQRVPGWFAFFGIQATQYSDVDEALEEALSDRRVERIRLRISSPGGTVAGVQETSDAIFEARAEKPIEAFIADLGASGAYWLASQAESVRASANAIVGSIGVYSVYRDTSKAFEEMGIKTLVIRSGEHKGMGVAGAPITDAQIASTQKVIDGLAESFVSAVARGRGIGEDEARAFATGEVWLSQQALSLGIVDAVGNPKESSKPAPAPAAESKAMSDKKQDPGAGERQRIQDLTKAFEHDPAFALKHINEGSSVLEAKAAYSDELQERIETNKKAHEDQLAAARAEAKAEAEQVRAELEARDRKESNPPIDPANVRGELTDPGDFIHQARGLAAEKGITVTAAMRELVRSNPGLHKSYLEKSRKKGRKVA